MALCHPEREPGVYNKIVGTAESLNKLGHPTKTCVFEGGSIGSYIQYLLSLSSRTEDVVIVRNNPSLGLIYILPFMLLRVRGKKIVLDIPTPFRNLLLENKIRSLWKRLLLNTGLIVSGPWSLWPVNRIVQCSFESKFFMLGNEKRTILTGNGINLDTVQKREKAPAWSPDRLVLIGVANVSFWQGYDRVIKAVAAFNQKSDTKAFFNIVGEGDLIEDSMQLVKRLNVGEYVSFKGKLNGRPLMDEYEVAHIAVSTLAPFRVNMECSSALKAREYSAIGIPFIAAGVDPDFKNDSNYFRYEVPNDDSIDGIVDLLAELVKNPPTATPTEIRRYAEERLGFDTKMTEILAGL